MFLTVSVKDGMPKVSIKDRFSGYPVLLVPLALLTAGQLSAKAAAGRMLDGSSLVSIYTLLMYLFYGLRALSWILIIRHVRLSFAYPFMSLAYCIVPLASALVFGEPLSARIVVGMLLVCGGLMLIASGEERR